MLFVIFVAILAAGIGLYIWYNHFYNSYADWIEVAYVALNVIGTLCVSISIIAMLFSYIGVDAMVEENKEIYNSLTYQYENAVFDDDDDAVGKKELYNQIQEWNANLRYNQSIQRDFLVGIYVPNVFDQFKLIEYDYK